MAAATESSSTSALALAYSQFDAALRVRQAKICSILAMTLVPACIGMDYFVYPGLLRQLFAGRVLCDLALLPCFLALFTNWGVRHIKLLGNAPPMLPAFSICWMIYATEGVFSPYYAGLNIVMVGVILLIPYTLREGILICAMIVCCYALACLLHRVRPPAAVLHTSQGANAATLFNNLYFLAMTAVIALAACHYTSLRRFEEFRLRFELDVNNRQLATTVRKLQETEVQLVQSEKMNALGKLSAGLLHEINNPLNFTFMALQLAEGEAGENESLKETLKDINQGMERIRTVISDLRAFAYPSKQTDIQGFSIDETLTTALRLTAHELGDIPVDRSAVNGSMASGAKTQVLHVFMNLLVNSAHALKSKSLGRPPQITISCAPGPQRLTIKVRDNGVGVLAEQLPRLCDPFFTTKQPGEGLGLGLSICHTIVANHGGQISIASEQGQWTEVSFDLPVYSSGSKTS